MSSGRRSSSYRSFWLLGPSACFPSWCWRRAHVALAGGPLRATYLLVNLAMVVALAASSAAPPTRAAVECVAVVVRIPAKLNTDSDDAERGFRASRTRLGAERRSVAVS